MIEDYLINQIIEGGYVVKEEWIITHSGRKIKDGDYYLNSTYKTIHQHPDPENLKSREPVNSWRAEKIIAASKSLNLKDVQCYDEYILTRMASRIHGGMNRSACKSFLLGIEFYRDLMKTKFKKRDPNEGWNPLMVSDEELFVEDWFEDLNKLNMKYEITINKL
jgi:hypothetical protein